MNPDTFHEFALYNDVITGTPYLDSLEWLDYNSGSKLNYTRLANKLETTGLYGGFAKVGIGMNTIPITFIKSLLNPNDPDAVVILDSALRPLNYTTWVEDQLDSLFEYDIDTSQFIVDGVNYSVDLTTADAENNTVSYTNTETGDVHTLDLKPEPIGDSYWVKYKINRGTDTSSGETVTVYSREHTWVYDIASDKYPELSLYTDVPDNDPLIFKVFPELPIRQNNTNYPSFSKHSEYDEYAETIGVDPQALVDSFAGQSDMDKLDHIAVTLGVNLKAKDKHSLRYCVDFVKKLIAIKDNYGVKASDVDPVHNKAFGMYEWSQNEGLGGVTDTLLRPFLGSEDLSGIELSFDFEEFSYTLKFTDVWEHTLGIAGIEMHQAVWPKLYEVYQELLNPDEDVYGLVRGGMYTSRICNDMLELGEYMIYAPDTPTLYSLRSILGEALSGNDSWHRDNNIIVYFELMDDHIKAYTLIQPVISHSVRDTQSGQVRTIYVDLQSTTGGEGATSDADIYFPLDWRIIEKYDNASMSYLVGSGLHMTMYYAYWEQEEVWDWGFLTVVVIIVVAIVAPQLLTAAFDALVKSIATAMAGGAAATAAGIAAMMATAQIIASVLILSSLGVFGDEAQLMATIAMAYFTFTSPDFTLGFNEKTFQLAGQGGDWMNSFRMEKLKDEFEAISSYYMDQLQDIEEKLDALNEIMEEMGYWKRQQSKQYTQISLLNEKNVVTLQVKDPGLYIEDTLAIVDPSKYYEAFYEYNYG